MPGTAHDHDYAFDGNNRRWFRAEIAQRFNGSESVAPGLAKPNDRRSTGSIHRTHCPEERLALCDVGRKP